MTCRLHGQTYPFGGRRTAVSTRIPVTPPVHVERVPSHTSCTWKANGLSAFLDAVAAEATQPTLLVDSRRTAGRQRRLLADIDPTTAITYVRYDTPDSWRVAWHRRTTPVVSLDGSLTPQQCRRLHRATTDCTHWPSDSFATLAELL